MNTLESLVNKVIERIRPVCLQNIDKKKKFSGNIAAISGALSIIAPYCWFSLVPSSDFIISLLLIMIPLSGTVIALHDYIYKKGYYKNFLNMNASNYNNHYIYEFSGGHPVLTDEETQELLSMDFSKENLIILHNAISNGSNIIFSELSEMYQQQQKEDRFVSNQAKLVEKGIYSDKQQKTFQDLNAINAIKTNYKTFNSKSVL